VVLHPDARDAAEAYRVELARGAVRPGARLRDELAGAVTALDDLDGFLEALFATKPPQIFAESEVWGDGRDWTARELSLLGDLGVAVDVRVFDDGRHASPAVHATALEGTLLFIPGVLLRNDRGLTPADWDAVVSDGEIDAARYADVYERRLAPLLRYADAEAAREGRRALVTVPGLGCGQFAGPFRGTLGARLEAALVAVLRRHARSLRHTAAVYYDPYGECENARHDFGSLSLRVRPLLRGNHDKPQLCAPPRYAEAGDDFGDCRLFSFVAWDHVSWPGNDFYGGARATDDGVKAAATSAIGVLTGVDGTYDPRRAGYLPPAPYRSWGELVADRRARVAVRGHVSVLP
jgi:hypothetical protein